MTWLRFAAFALACLASGAAGAADPEPVKVRIGLFITISDAGIFAAIEKGYFREQGIEVSLTQVDTASTVSSALVGNSIDVAGDSPGAHLYNGIRQGFPFRMVADKGSSPPGHGYIAVMVRKDLAATIKNPADIKGRTIALTGYRSGVGNEVTLHHLLEMGKLKESDVNVINMSFPDVLAGLGTGGVGIGILIEPLVTRAVDQDIAVAWKRTDEIYPYQTSGMLVYGPGMTSRPEVGKRFMVAYLKGVRFYNDALAGRAPRDELVAILVKNTAVKTPALYQKMTFPGIDPNGALSVERLTDDMRWMVEAGRLKEPADIAKAIDGSYAAHAVQQLGAYR